MSIINEFKQFAIKGNVVDMAVGIIIGAAFGKIVGSVVADVMMPPLGYIMSGINFTHLEIVIKEAVDGAPAVTIAYGKFIQSIIDFTITAFAIFMVVKGINRLRRNQEAEVAAAPPAPTKDQELLSEIRDLLKKQK